MVEIKESEQESTPLIPKPLTDSVTESVTDKKKGGEAEIHLYRCGKGPIAVFKTSLGGWDQDQLEVAHICDKYGFKSVFAFNPGSGRGAPIRFNRRNGRSLLPYRHGSVIIIDGEPKDSIVKPITRIILGLALSTIMIAFLLKENPKWMAKLNLNISGGNFPPWIIACVVIVFTRMRKRTRDFFRSRGW